MDITKLNLARKWRSHNFEGIIGQDLAVKMLKNSLYAGHYFPVYLFSGQRGCGKTTTARIFASALNCDQLDAFQKKPKETIVPCGFCASCVAVRQGSHQDFVEMDAASHTGVDTIRQLIEDASFLPVIGRKKVYLIDEAHMLSKAAFNALLKILEEPPASAIFILATTDSDKIIETVRSRCFTLYFKPIKTAILSSHLISVCQSEKITYKDDGLLYIAAHAEGSARDALNILEQVRFASGGVTKQTVLSVLGHMDDLRLIELLTTVATGSVKDVLAFWQQHDFDIISADFVWRRLLVLARALIWLHHGVIQEGEVQETMHALQESLNVFSLHFLHQLMEALYKAEPLFIRTTAQQGLLEMVLLQLCRKKKNTSSGESGSALSASAVIVQDGDTVLAEESEDDEQEDDKNNAQASWGMLCKKIETLGDPLLASLFSQGIFRFYDQKVGELTVVFPSHLSFFVDRLHDTRAQWEPLIQTIFGTETHFNTLFDQIIIEHKEQDITEKKRAVEIQRSPVRHVQEERKFSSANLPRINNRPSSDVRERLFDVSDAQQWQKVNLVLKHFSGTVTEVQEVR